MISKNLQGLIGILCLFSGNPLTAQSAEIKPSTSVWGSRLLNHQTATLPQNKQMMMYVVHYFGPVSRNGIGDLFGLYGSSNIQLGLEYGFSKDFSAYFFSEKLNKTQELGLRYKLLNQDADKEIPVNAALSLSLSADTRDKKYYGENYYFINRFFYTTQIAISGKIHYRWEIMVNNTFTHLNIVPEGSYSTFFSVNPAISYKLNRKYGLFTAFDFPLGIASASEEQPQNPRPIMSCGIIMNSSHRNFQLFLSTGNMISPAKEYLNNKAGFSVKELRLGFNIRILF